MKQKYTADDIKKIYEKSLPQVRNTPYKNAPIIKQEDLKEPDTFLDNISQPFKNIKSNYQAGNLGEKESQAWSVYRARQDQESLKAAERATKEREQFAKNNQNVGQGNILTKNFAEYLPQMKNQIVSGLSNVGNRALMGAGAGASTALIAGQLGPQVLAPEEIVTVPAGAVTGAVVGGKAGYMEGVAKYSYNQMSGSAYKGLLDLGVPNEIALKVSADEALISSLIEAAGAGVDIATLGIGKLLTKGGTNALGKIAKNRLVSALKAYGINVASEALEEGLQEKVSIESEKKALKQSNLPRQATWEQDLERIIESAKGGAAIAAVSGGANAIGNFATNTINNNQIKNAQQPTQKIKVADIIKNNQDVVQPVNQKPILDSTKLPTIKDNKVNEQIVNDNMNVAQNANKDLVDNNVSKDSITDIDIENSMPELTEFYKKDLVKEFDLASQEYDKAIETIQNYFQTNELRPNEQKAIKGELGIDLDKIVNRLVEAENKLNSVTPEMVKMKHAAGLTTQEEMNTILKNKLPNNKPLNKLPTINGQILKEQPNVTQNVNKAVTEENKQPVKKSGILIDENSEQYKKNNPHDYKYLDILTKSVGVKIKFEPTINVKLADGSIQRNAANGYYDPYENTIVISQDTSNPVMVVAKHELTHLMQDRNPALYKQYKEFVVNSMKKKGTYDKEFENLSKNYKGVTKDIEDEIVSNASALYLEGDKQSIQDIINYNPSMAKKVYEFIQDLIDKFKTVMGKDTGNLNISQLRKAEKLWASMLDETIKDNEARTEVKGDVKYSLKDNKGNNLTEQQAKYFKDSVIKDREGNIKLVYHGGNVENEFDTTRGKEATQYGSGAYFTDAYGVAEEWSKERKGKIIEGYINIKKPFDDRELNKKSKEYKNLIKILKEEKGFDEKDINRVFAESEYVKKDTPFVELRKLLAERTNAKKGFWTGAELANEVIRQAGYDGIIGDLYDSEQYVIFNPEQIKLADNKKPSTSNDIRYSLKDSEGKELTKEQQEYFKDSKVRDKDGNLLKLYHGTKNNFNEFIPSKGGEFGSGIYLTDNKETAMWYAKNVSRGDNKPSAIETYVNITNPYEISKEDYIKKTERTTPNTLKNKLIKQGYDGIIGIGLNGYEKQYVAFNPEQIKSVDNLNPTKDKDIRFSLKDQPKDIKTATVNTNKLPTKSQLTFLEDANKRITEAQQMSMMDDNVADVLVSSKGQNKLPVKKAIDNTVDALKRKFTDSGNTIATIGKITKDSTLYTMYNNARQARQAAEYVLSEAQTDILGNKVGESLKDIFEPIRKNGDEYYKKFSEYMFHMHNIDRMAQGKPVFGESVTAEKSKKKVLEYEKSNPEFIKFAGKIYKYNQNLMQYRLDTGLISMEQAQAMFEMYPNYVPTYRSNATSTGSKAGKGTVEITQGIKKATGSDKDLLPLHEQMARQTMQVVQAGKRNIFGNRLLSNAVINKDKLGEYIQTIQTEKAQADIDEDERTMPELKNAFVIFNNGERTTLKVNPGLYEGVKAISSEAREITPVERGAKLVNTTFKKLVTAYSPMFTVRNMARDIQDAGLYSKDLSAFIKAYPKAIAEIKKNGELWQKYQALGGFGSSIFDYDRGYLVKERRNVLTKSAGTVTDKIEAVNFVTEQLPRFAEFIATIEKGNGSYENLMQAMYNAADITVNFGRMGSWGKVINSTFVPFFNPAVQGTSKIVRQFTETKGVKNWTRLVIKAAALGIAPSIINALMYDDDDEYKKVTDRDKDTNFLIKVGKDKWVKIPKGRVLSLIGNAAQRGLRTAKGEENAWAGYIDTAADSTLPMNPFTENIVAPFMAVKSNTTWYGTPIESQGLQQFKPGERYDEKTDSFSIALGKMLNYSPKKINYLLDSYTGVIGDFVLPIMTKQAETNPFVKSFVIDSTLSNKISTDFYNKIEEIKFDKNSIEEDNYNDVIYRFMNKQASAASDLNKELKTIQNSDLKDSEKKVKVKELKSTINAIQQNALKALEKYKKSAEKNFKKYNDVDDAYLYTNKEIFGSEYAIKVYNKKIYEKYLESGKSAEEYFKEYFEKKEEETKIKLPTIKTAGIKLPTINNKK